MNEPEKLIEGSERLTSVYGYWPSFHDAEVIDFNLWRGDVDPEQERYIFPVITTKIHLWELTSEVNALGGLVTRHQTLATLRFHDVDEFHMDGFNHQNAICGLGITTEERDAGLSPFFRVVFEPAFGITSTFRCTRIEVLHAEPFPQSNRNV